jgi:hypothetical protein
VTACPHKVIDRAAYDVPMAADLAKRGSWPETGGWLDQTASCLNAVRAWWALDAAGRAGLGIKEED